MKYELESEMQREDKKESQRSNSLGLDVLKPQVWTLRDEYARVDIAGLDVDRLDND